jgi:hypothetical protein
MQLDRRARECVRRLRARAFALFLLRSVERLSWVSVQVVVQEPEEHGCTLRGERRMRNTAWFDVVWTSESVTTASREKS